MAYSKQTWADGEDGGTPITADRLNHIEEGIAAAEQVPEPTPAPAAGSAALLNSGVNTEQRTWTAKDLAAYVAAQIAEALPDDGGGA